MQLVKSINCTALCLDSSRLIVVVWACPQGARGKGSFLPLQIHVSASKCGCQEAGEEGAAVAPRHRTARCFKPPERFGKFCVCRESLCKSAKELWRNRRPVTLQRRHVCVYVNFVFPSMRSALVSGMLVDGESQNPTKQNRLPHKNWLHD